ncbi:hypothetical protein [Nocardia sp. SYP-A9097]|uniref:hypothetical protein n=1 Tax=Nocardia sp. SYP-A9097 TaxID=2663237 RepID=UPI00129A8A24|nr:hypothetical protein [Nocardia sp. SYP-A9097]
MTGDHAGMVMLIHPGLRVYPRELFPDWAIERIHTAMAGSKGAGDVPVGWISFDR